MGHDILIRRAGEADAEAILALLANSLAWSPDDDFAAFFFWKHRENPFGESPGWVALDAGRVVGYRTFLRWDFDWDGRRARTVRAVDTAVARDHRGQGIFSRLTRQALDELEQEGVEFVFNTPNDQSRPGYLKMGWEVVGRQQVFIRPHLSWPSLRRTATARRASDRWSEATGIMAGTAAGDVLDDAEAMRSLLAGTALPSGLGTRRSPEFLRWRYGFAPLGYRVLLVGRDLSAGLLIYRLHRRGSALEAAVCEVLLPDEDARRGAVLLRTLRRTCGADHVVAIGAAGLRNGFLPLPGQGPILVWRPLSQGQQPRRWALTLGDLELF